MIPDLLFRFVTICKRLEKFLERKIPWVTKYSLEKFSVLIKLKGEFGSSHFGIVLLFGKTC